MSQKLTPSGQVLEFLEGGKFWTKGSFIDEMIDEHDTPQITYCYVGALRHLELYNDYGTVASVIREEYPDRLLQVTEIICCCPPLGSENHNFGCDENTIITFNDHQDTTWQDIERVAQKAMIREMEKVEPGLLL